MHNPNQNVNDHINKDDFYKNVNNEIESNMAMLLKTLQVLNTLRGKYLAFLISL